jgi:hypothetical protein
MIGQSAKETVQKNDARNTESVFPSTITPEISFQGYHRSHHMRVA